MEEIQKIIETLIGDYGWLIITGFITIFFKNSIENAFNGIKFMAGNDFNLDNIVNIKGERCRIVRQGIFKTTFYSLDDNSIFHIQNNKLQSYIIKKQLTKE